MKTLSLKLDDEIFKETDLLAGQVNMARNRYINEALSVYNLLISRKILKEKLHKESKSIRNNSMDVLRELENIVDDL